MKARQLTERIYALLEGMNDTSAYMRSACPAGEILEKGSPRRINDDPLVYHFTFSKGLLARYRKDLRRIAYHPDWKYIYQLKRRIETFRLGKRDDIPYLVGKGVLLDSAADASVPSIDGLLRHFNWNSMAEYGVLAFLPQDKDKVEVLVSGDKAEAFLSSLELVDGNARRFDTGTAQDISIPAEVLRELVNYTNNSNDTFSEEVTEWLMKMEKPYKEITLYRTFGVTMDMLWDALLDKRDSSDDSPAEYNDYWEEGEDFEDGQNEYDREPEIQELMEILQGYMGISEPDEFRKGVKVQIARNKESSWSTDPRISSSFSSDDFRDFNVMVKATVPASFVVADLNLLPKQLLKDKFRYWTQNEVILVNRKIPAVITNVWISDKGREWLSEQDYDFSPAKGITSVWD